MRLRAAVDTGGTFTDVCLLREDTGELWMAKIISTPDDPARAVMSGLARAAAGGGLDPAGIRLLVHGTTVATNALLEGKGAPAALITTRGFADVLRIGRQDRPDLYDFRVTRPAPLIPRRLTFEINERILAGGKIYITPDEAEVRAVVEEIRRRGVSSIAVSLLHSYANPVHEKKVREIIHAVYPQAVVTLSSEILPVFREYERTATAAVNAVVLPRVAAYLARLETALGRTGNGGTQRTGDGCARRAAAVGSGGPGLFIMHSGGGVITAAQAQRESARTVLSGPAGGVLAGVQLAAKTGRPNLITADMGGTSMDISLIRGGKPRYTTEGSIGGHPLSLPMLDIHTIGAGGGSIAWIDAGGALRVGPASAGADPGPACYGLGGEEPTVTDANLVLGRLDPAHPLTGERPLQLEPARRSIAEKIARPLGLMLEEAAAGIIAVVNAAMARAVRVVSVQRGLDPRDFTLLAFGGAGPLHAAELAREASIPHALIPRHPGVASALGMLAADVRLDYARTVLLPLAEATADELARLYAPLEEAARRELAAEGFSPAEMLLERAAGLRYAGQSYTLDLPVPAGALTAADLHLLTRSFHLEHRREYGYRREDAPVEITLLRLAATGRLPAFHGPFRAPAAGLNSASRLSFGRHGKGRSAAGVGPDGPPPPAATRPVFFQDACLPTPVYERTTLAPGQSLTGPALIRQEDTTTLLWPQMRLTVDRLGNLIIETGVR
ncbi:5-oxoprolinase [Desulfotomaculum copahuensis]|uniref:5-oxoprolinase n=1 Tax=Desulfotomaculum copahuensis TaxID=1838280 RepID=A0A1B7LGR7_9FIRM|nr:5-oxoprolinase [Desulfotomaculum copahuensis]